MLVPSRSVVPNFKKTKLASLFSNLNLQVLLIHSTHSLKSRFEPWGIQVPVYGATRRRKWMMFKFLANKDITGTCGEPVQTGRTLITVSPHLGLSATHHGAVNITLPSASKWMSGQRGVRFLWPKFKDPVSFVDPYFSQPTTPQFSKFGSSGYPVSTRSQVWGETAYQLLASLFVRLWQLEWTSQILETTLRDATLDLELDAPCRVFAVWKFPKILQPLSGMA